MEKFRKMHAEYFPLAFEEIKNGEKKSDWIWFIFPQIVDLGRSKICKMFELKSLDEAKEFLNDQILSQHLVIITKQLLTNRNKKIFDIMNTDDIKLLSCMTLFNIADTDMKFNGIFQDKNDRRM